MTRFDRDTAPEALGDGRYRVSFDRAWWVVRGPNGGIVAAAIVRSMEAELGAPERQLRSLTVHYLAAPAEGDAEVAVTIERSGRSLSTVTARLYDDGRTLAIAIAAFALPYPGVLEHHDAPAPEIGPPGEMAVRDLEAIPIGRQYAMRSALGAEGEALVGGWIELAEQRPIDSALIVALTDAWWPAPFELLDHPVAAPTIDLTVHVRAALPRPPQPVIAEFRTSQIADGYFEEDGRLWAADGTLLAQSRQLALLI